MQQRILLARDAINNEKERLWDPPLKCLRGKKQVPIFWAAINNTMARNVVREEHLHDMSICLPLRYLHFGDKNLE